MIKTRAVDSIVTIESTKVNVSRKPRSTRSTKREKKAGFFASLFHTTKDYISNEAAKVPATPTSAPTVDSDNMLPNVDTVRLTFTHASISALVVSREDVQLERDESDKITRIKLVLDEESLTSLRSKVGYGVLITETISFKDRRDYVLETQTGHWETRSVLRKA